MHHIFRASLLSLAGLLIMSGLAVLVLSVMMHRMDFRGMTGGVITIACGIMIVRAAFRRRGPRWLVRLLNP